MEINGSWDISVSIVTSLQAGRPEFDSRQGRIVLFATTFRPTQPHIQCVQTHPASYSMRTDVISAGLKWPGLKTEYSIPSSTSSGEVKNAWS
jgi:hypothetical protein